MSKRGITAISGAADSRSAFLIADIIRNEQERALIITATEARAQKLADDLSFFLGRDAIPMPGEEDVFLSFEARSQGSLRERLRALHALRTDPQAVVVAPASAAIKRMILHAAFENRVIRLAFGQETDPADLAREIAELGYARMGMVEERGEFSLRGGILDIFPPDSPEPYRIEFFDTEVDSIRTFDLETQRSLENLQEIEISPAQQMLADPEDCRQAAAKIRERYTAQATRLTKAGREAAAENLKKRRDALCEYIEHISNRQLLENYIHYFYDEAEFLWDYLAEGGLLFIDDPDRIIAYLETRQKEQRDSFDLLLERGEVVPKDAELLTGKKEFFGAYRHEPVWILQPFPKAVRGADRLDRIEDVPARQVMTFHGDLELLKSETLRYFDRGYEVTYVVSTAERKRMLFEFAQQEGFAGRIRIAEGVLSEGVDFPDRKVCFIAESNLFGSKRAGVAKRKRTTKNRYGQQIEHFTDLKKGDYVVHEDHGIGKFLGIEQLTVQGEKKDYLKIKYAGTDLLYVPVEQFDIVQKYIGADEAAPKINKLAGSEWKNTKARARRAIQDMTDELVRLYAQRELEQGYAFSPDTVWQQEFEDSFPYQETEDQLRSVREIKADMEKPEPMDRLLCGDVGFGKTEVAARAIFKCLIEGKQAAVLVPTTLLANQHFYTLKARFEQFPFQVEVLSRFRSPEEQKATVQALRDGKVDLIIGTHRLLSGDIAFRDLGLLVIDEEQRFGVQHKEKIKQLKHNVDVLTLSATPIPRTLNMSLTGIKNMSVIEEPPEERYPVQTYVMEQDEQVLREVLKREMDRGGQAFVVYNRVNGIERIADWLGKLLPEARIAVGHGRMSERALERVMVDFVEGKYDILLATTIIESGIDIPNANTLVVLNADYFGLAQLYQLRGRVGRSNRVAYAYLMYQRDKVLTEASEKRLRAIREFTEFGSGFKIAMRDLQIRGAGNLLGSEQSGHIMAIGYELYCKMVNDAVRRLRGETVEERVEDASIELNVSANIPDWYIADETLKIEAYKKIAGVAEEQDADELLDEFVDRFGDVPRETMALVKVSRIRSLAERLSVSRIYEEKGYIFCSFPDQSKIPPYSAVTVQEAFGQSALIHGGQKPFIRITMLPRKKLDDVIRLLEAVREGQRMGAAQR